MIEIVFLALMLALLSPLLHIFLSAIVGWIHELDQNTEDE